MVKMIIAVIMAANIMILMIIIRALTMLTFQAEESDTFRAGLFTTGGAGATAMMMMMMMMKVMKEKITGLF